MARTSMPMVPKKSRSDISLPELVTCRRIMGYVQGMNILSFIGVFKNIIVVGAFRGKLEVVVLFC
jgi:hypothetical protein